ncbi:hypothetical protein [Nitrincola sp.]|uniref:hypothetical protein n=1 Tax=Nitrincola sp. TaxID=1926584 RepID=UPI003A90006F
MTDDQTPDKGKPSRQWMLLVLIALVLLALVVLPQWVDEQRTEDSVFIPPLPCDLHQGGCIASAGKQVLQLNLSPKPLVSMQSLSIEVRLQHFDARQVMLDLQGVEMYMGLNQTALQQDPERPDVWRGTTELAVCTTGEMTWRAIVYIDTADTLYSTHFDFEAR